MDNIDHEIIRQLQRNGRISLKNLARQVSLTAPAVAERIHKLEESKVILGYTAVVNIKKLDRNIMAVINVTIDPEKQGGFLQFADKTDSIVSVKHVTGPFSMCVTAVFQDVAELNGLVSQIQRFGRTQTLIVLSTPICSAGADYLV